MASQLATRVQRATLAVACLATAMLRLDIAVVNTAIPRIGADLMLTRRHLSAFALLILAAAAMVLPSPSRAAAPLAAVPTSARGWHPRPARRQVALADLISGLAAPRRGAVRPDIRRRAVQSAAAARPGAALRDEAFVLASARAAGRVVGWWDRGRGRRAAIGRGGRLIAARGVASVIWREGVRVGLLVLRQRGPRTALRAAALADARFADVALQVKTPADSWLRVLSGVDAQGRVSRQTALQAFALAYGPLSGVRTPTGRHAPIDSGTLAALWTLAYRSRLTPAQRVVVNRRLGVGGLGAAHSAAVTGSGSDETFVPDPHFQAVVDHWSAVYAGLLRGPLTLRLIAGRSADTGGALADSTPLDATNRVGHGPAPVCRIRVGPSAQAQPDQYQQLELAHEVFHCYEFQLLGPRVWEAPQAWIMEGLAEWASLTVDPESFYPLHPGGGGKKIEAYLRAPKLALFSRAYDASGYWGHLADVTGPLWPRTAAILTAPNDTAAFAAAGGLGDDVLASWGPSAFRVSPVAGFTMHSPIEPPGFSQLPPGSLEDVRAGLVGAAPYTTSQYEVHPVPGIPIVHIAIDGPARLLSGGTGYTDLHDAWFCVQGFDCRCPPGSDSTVPPTQALSEPAYLGVTGAPDAGTSGVVEPFRLDDFCHPHRRPSRPVPPGPQPGPLGCDAGCGSSNGDPHLHPFTADPYEFQAAGEFVLTRSVTGRLEIQARQQPWEKSNELSVNTAFAMRVGSTTVELDAGRSMTLRVDHHRRPLPARSLTLQGGGRLRTLAPPDPSGGSAVEVIWPDGSRARVWPIADFGVAIVVAPARSLTGKLAGLLGNLGGPANADFSGRDGRRYPGDLITGDGPTASAGRYGGFGESWRVRPASSLFTYGRGKSTRSYTIRGFPLGVVDLAGEPAAQRIEAEQLCQAAGVSDPAALADCVVDVLGTGDRRFAASARAMQAAAGNGTFVSMHPWTKLSSSDDSATDVVASLAPGGAAITAAYRRDVDGSVEVAVLAPGVDGVTLRSRSVPMTGWTSVADPVLAPAAGGDLGLLVAGLHGDNSADPLNGTSLFPLPASGGLGAPSALSPTVADGLGASVVLAADRATPLWSSTTGNQLAVHLGAQAIDLSSLSPGIPIASALGYDAAGELWLAWHSVGSGAADGIYLLRLDPATGSPGAGAAPLHAPGSEAGNVQARLPLACAAVCRVVYVDSRRQTTDTLDSWAPGEAAPTVVAHDTAIHSPAAAVAADGRLWVTWVSADVNSEWATVVDPR